MNRHNVALSDFEVVTAISRLGSFRLAAEELGLSPSALSRQLSSLETRLSVRLFDRDTRNVSITASGAAFVKAAERMLNTADGIMLDFEAHLSARHGQLTIAGLPSITAALLPRLLTSFARDHADIDLEILDVLSQGVVEAVESGAADIGFTAGTVSTRSRLSFLPLLEEPFLAVGSKDGPLDPEKSYQMADLIRLPFVAMAKGTSVRELLDGTCQQLGLTLNPRFEVSHLATAGALVAENLGISILPALTLPILRAERLAFCKIEDFGSKRRIGVVHRSGATLSPSARALLAHVKSQKHGLHETSKQFPEIGELIG